MAKDFVILVNEDDQATGEMEKMEAHELGLLHRAFSVFIFNRKGEMLLQRRALTKYHSGGLWTNACCSHPRPGEDTRMGAQRRLQEELGFTIPLRKIFDFTYSASFDNGLIENEFDHVFIGMYEEEILPNEVEVMDVAYRPLSWITKDLHDHPEKYTAWFHIAFPRIRRWADEQFNTLEKRA